MQAAGCRRRSAIARMMLAVAVIIIIVVAAVATYSILMGAPSSQPQQVVNVSFAMATTVWNVLELPAFTAQAFGFFRHEGVNVSWQLLNGGPLSVKALSSGNAQFAWGAPGANIGAISSGTPLKVILSSNTGTAYEIVTNTKLTASPSSIKGTNWGVESVGGASYEIDVEYLKGIGLTANDVNWVTVGSPALRAQALIAQKVDAAALSLDTASVTATPANSFLHILADTTTLGKYVFSPTSYISTSQDMITNNPKVVEGIVKGYIEACRALATNRTLFAAAINQMSPGAYNQSQIQSFYPMMTNYWAVNGAMNQAQVQNYLNLYFTLLNPKGTQVTLSQSVDYTFVKQALNSLGVQQAAWDPVDYSLK